MRADLQAILTQEQLDAGLYLAEPDDHVLLLKRGDKVLVGWSQTGVTAEAIRLEADHHLAGG